MQSTIRSIDPTARRVETDAGSFDADGTEMPHDLFLGVPVHVVPPVVAKSGMCVDGWIPVNPLTLETEFDAVRRG